MYESTSSRFLPCSSHRTGPNLPSMFHFYPTTGAQRRSGHNLQSAYSYIVTRPSTLVIPVYQDHSLFLPSSFVHCGESYGQAKRISILIRIALNMQIEVNNSFPRVQLNSWSPPISLCVHFWQRWLCDILRHITCPRHAGIPLIT